LIVLDLAFPGSDPAALVDAARSVGAEGIAGYLRNWPQWTPSLARGILQRGLSFLPIELYNGQAPSDTLTLLRQWGLPIGPVALDVEPGSFPSTAWQAQWQQAIDGAGYESVGYSQASLNVPYRWRWKAQYTWPGQPDQRSVQPVQPIPSGYDAVQYAHDIPLDRFEVDASNFGFPLAGGELPPPPPPPPPPGGARMFDFRPGDPNLRCDYVYVDQAGHLKHRWANGGLAGVLGNDASEEDMSAGLQFVPLSASCRWDPAGANLNIAAIGLEGELWGLFKDIAGVGPGWFSAAGARAAVGRPGPQGPPGPATLVPHTHAVPGTTSGPAQPT
jgi:hypothetical protein